MVRVAELKFPMTAIQAFPGNCKAVLGPLGEAVCARARVNFRQRFGSKGREQTLHSIIESQV